MRGPLVDPAPYRYGVIHNCQKRQGFLSGIGALCGKKQVDMAASFGMSKQTMGNKMNRGSWSANDLAKAAEFCGCKLAFIMPDGQQIIIDVEEKEKAPGE